MNKKAAMRCIGRDGDIYYVVNPKEQNKNSPTQSINSLRETEVVELMQSGEAFANMALHEGVPVFAGNGMSWDVNSAYTMFKSICDFLSHSLKLGDFTPSRMYTSSLLDYSYYNYKSPASIKYMRENRGFHAYFRVYGDTQEFPLYSLLELHMYDQFHANQNQYFMRCSSVTEIETVCKRFVREVTEAKRAEKRNEIDSFLNNCIAYAKGTPDGIFFLMDVIREKAPEFGYTPEQVVACLNKRVRASMDIFHVAYEGMANNIPAEYDMEESEFMRDPTNYAFVGVLTKGFMKFSYERKVEVCKPELLCYFNHNFNKKV